MRKMEFKFKCWLVVYVHVLLYMYCCTCISVKSSPSLGGSYEGVEPHGLIWSVQPFPDVADKLPRLVKFDVTTPMKFFIDLLDQEFEGDGKVLDSKSMERWYLADYVDRIPVKMGRAEGVWFIPKKKGEDIVLVNILVGKKISNAFDYKDVWVLKALWIILSEIIIILRKIHKTNIFGMPPKCLP